MELIDIVLSKQYVKNNASSIFQNIWVETVLITGSKRRKRTYLDNKMLYSMLGICLQ